MVKQKNVVYNIFILMVSHNKRTWGKIMKKNLTVLAATFFVFISSGRSAFSQEAGKCEGIAQSCKWQYGYNSCLNVIGCTWVYMSTSSTIGDCFGTSYQCSELSKTVCRKQPGCYWVQE
jgi:hypothetical protein